MTYISGVVEGFYGRPWTNEQRKHLFSLLRRFGMNTYLYAPKDDLKHRAEWRLLYTAEEAALLESLIKTANENGITFVYALSPGIDIVYSSNKEIKAIQDKLTQVRSLGCSAFSLLFDDIETKMNEMDRKQFSSFSLAQLTVANSVYELMDSPLFFFCPTEYCESCSVPNLNESEYLSLLGSKLHPDINILWTGPRVVSRLLTVEHLQRVSNVLRRKPMIWDNLHANDYDPKRIFMGPFMGRSVAIKNETSGLLLNPNCKYEANYIPLFTLSDWVQADLDAPKVEEDQNAVLESTVSEEAVKVVERSKSARLYHPLTSLRRALNNWLPQFCQGPGPNIPPLSQRETQAIAPVIEPNAVSSAEIPPPTIRTCDGNEMLSDLPAPIYTSPIGHATTVCVQAFPLSEAIIGVVEAHDCSAISKAPQTVNSLTTDYNEPMEIPAAGTYSKEDIRNDGKTMTGIPMDLDFDSSIRKSIQSSSMDSIKNINMENVALFVDIFYLPFEHGKHGVTLLNELKWLYENAKIIKIDEKNGKESEEWHRRFKGFLKTNNQLTELYQNVIKSPNKSLLQEIFPYLWEAQGLISVLCALLAWIRYGNLLLSLGDSTIWSADEVDPDSLEPWALGGGLLPDLQKLIVSSPKLGEIFTVKFAIPLSLRCYKIRPVDLHQIDKTILFELFASTNEKKLSAIVAQSSSYSPEQIFFDRTFAPFLKYGIPAHHFIAESAGDEENGGNHQPCSLALGILNFAGILDDLKQEFLPLFKAKYSKRHKNEADEMEDDDGNGPQEIDGEICRRLEAVFCLSKEFFSIYQSMVEIRWPTDVNEAVSVRRLLHCVSASLSLNGSTGFFTIIESDEDGKLELLTRLGLDIIDHSTSDSDNNSGLMNGFTIMGHTL